MLEFQIPPRESLLVKLAHRCLNRFVGEKKKKEGKMTSEKNLAFSQLLEWYN
jgi:hypothetical protein